MYDDGEHIFACLVPFQSRRATRVQNTAVINDAIARLFRKIKKKYEKKEKNKYKYAKMWFYAQILGVFFLVLHVF